MVLHSRHTCENFTNYEVHRDKHAGSDHRLITFELKGTAEFPKKLWEDSTGVPKKWTDENISKILITNCPSLQVVRRASTLTDVLTQASEHMVKTRSVSLSKRGRKIRSLMRVEMKWRSIEATNKEIAEEIALDTQKTRNRW